MLNVMKCGKCNTVYGNFVFTSEPSVIFIKLKSYIRDMNHKKKTQNLSILNYRGCKIHTSAYKRENNA